MFNLSLLCSTSVLFFGVCGMLGYVLSAYQRLLAEHEATKAALKKYEDQVS